ncbi:Thiol-disulfide oxidoreductase ResA [Zhongshania aliphaticivorans]|uniref:Thiol-disulfide oxidoreductase ResA n=1 Tax=Zhongshania aliphaticivorans TaxID=1470434 RepID=A0A5S9NUJ7_9GAMM|nr:redoxin domain-containing protein [Zhongshania aliphaticivorans]CAA0094302.1 Thiol-disulfide oxidoreductase ResA [Zhongshania aliphaticivorans]CAA0112386.1 Thiol-disulfide oxidoreductase ResA [Zhongshania aliphaticivorans]
MIKGLISRLKRWYAIPYLLLCIGVSIQSIAYLLGDAAFSYSWLGALVAVGPLVLFMSVVYALPYTRIVRFIAFPVVSALLGAVLAVIEMRPLPTFYTLFFGLGGVLVYVFWYTYLDRSDNILLHKGAKLPDFTLTSLAGEPVVSSSFIGKKVLWIFFRGNWCPMCQAQLDSLAKEFDTFKAYGVEMVLISPQSRVKSIKQKSRMPAPMQFFEDQDNQAAQRLGIVHRYGVPLGIRGYGHDTTLPTVIMTDELGCIIYVDLTDNFRIRPKPEALLEVLSHG